MQMISQSVRLARPDELGDAGMLVASSFASFRRSLPSHIFEPYVSDASDLASRQDEAEIAVIEHERRLAGTVTYYPDAAGEGMGWPSGFAGLRTLAVSPIAQGHGYGRALCEWCVTRARRQGAAAIALHTASFMVSACRIYENIGFRRQPSHDLLASDVLGFDPVLGDQRILAYKLPIRDAGNSSTGRG